MNTSTPLISVVLSFRNEELIIPEMIRRLQAVFRPLPVRYEIIFVNDDSTDRSLELLLEQRAKDPNIKIINTARRFGVTPCVLAGFDHAKGDAVIHMDADLQDPPELIPVLIEKWQQGADVVHTTRSKRHGEPRLKLWITSQAYRILNCISEYPLLKNTGDFKLLSRKVLNIILSLHEGDPYVRGLASWAGFRQEQVFYERAPRYAGKTKVSLLHSMNPYREFFRGITGFSDIPLYLGFICGGGFLLGLVAFVIVAVLRGLTGHGFSPWLAFSALFCLSMAVLFSFLSLLGMYLGAVLRQVRTRPAYVLKETIGFDADKESVV
jgi:polyisoprenyl-phosphate glycosyltransferase